MPEAEQVRLRSRAGRDRPSLGFQAVSLAAGTATAQTLTAVMYLVAARNADPARFGVLVAAISVGLAGVGVVDFGANALWIRELASRRWRADELGLRLVVKIGCGGFLGLVWLLGSRYVEGTWSSGVSASILLTTLVSQTMAVFPRAAARADLAAVSVMIDRTSAFASMIVIITWVGAPPLQALWFGLCLGALVGALVSWVLTPRMFRPSVHRRQQRNPWRGASAFGVSTLANSGQTLDVAVLAQAASTAAAGVYGAVSRWTQPMGLVVSAFSQASAPVVADATSWGDAWHRVRRSLWLPALAVVGCLVVAAASPLLVPLLLGQDYRGSAAVLTVLAMGTIPAVLNQPLSVFLQSRGHQKPVAVIFVMSVAVQLLTVALMASRWGATSGAIGLLVGQVCQLAALLLLLRHLVSAPGRAT